MIPRYRTAAMDRLFSAEAIFERWTEVELAACEAWADRGEVGAEDMAILRERAAAPTPARVREIEKETNHDVVAFVRALAEVIDHPASRHVHRGMTSSDVLDTALAMGMRDGVAVLEEALAPLEARLASLVGEHLATPCPGRTHGMHAEPTSFGLRVAGWYTELGRSRARLARAREAIAVGKLSGAVGNFSQTDPEFEAFVMDRLGLAVEPVATQVVPRDRHAEVLATLALLGAGLERWATEIRSLSRSELEEVLEPESDPPRVSEELCGAARLLRTHAHAALENVALWHDRDISHSSVERVIVPDAFHLAHWMLREMTAVLAGLRVDRDRMRANIDKTRGMIFSQNVLTALTGKGLERKDAYARVQACAMQVADGAFPDFPAALAADELVSSSLGADEIAAAFGLERYLAHVPALATRAGVRLDDGSVTP